MSPLATARAPPAYRYSASRAVAASRVPADTPQAATARHRGMGGAALLCLERLYKDIESLLEDVLWNYELVNP